MDNLQTEVLELEFYEFSKGNIAITEVDFAKILLRYTYLVSLVVTVRRYTSIDKIIFYKMPWDRVGFDLNSLICRTPMNMICT